MRTYEGFPAPDRDLGNVEPEVPPAEPDIGQLTGGLLPMLTIAMGIAACLWAAIGIVVEGNPAPTVAMPMVGAGICFIASGLLMRTRSLLPPVIAAACGILLGIASQTIL